MNVAKMQQLCYSNSTIMVKQKSLWKNRNFVLLWGGQAVSWLGTEVSGIAMPLVVLALTGSPVKAGFVAAIRGAAYETPVERKAIHHEITEAFSWYRKQPTIRFFNLVSAGRIGIIAGLYLLIIVLARQLHASATSIGLIFAVAAIGEIVGSVASSKLHSRFRLKQILTVINLLSFAFFCLYAFAGNIFLLAVITAFFYALDPLHNITTFTYATTITPDAIRGESN
jgi:predicted MFS family arabinose efflux permease